MGFGFKHKWAMFVVVVMAITPLVFEHAVHCLVPCAGKTPHGCLNHAHSPCDSNDGEHRSNELPASDTPCSVCDFIAMPCGITDTFTWHCVPDLVESREPEPVCAFLALYRPFEHGRAPPVVS